MTRNVSRRTDLGSGQCYVGHDDVPAGSPKDFITMYVTGASTVFLNNQPITTIGTIGTTDCGHTTMAVTGSNTVFAENKAIHRINDIGVINEGDGVYHSITASPDVSNDN